MEEWRDIVGYEGVYRVSNLGNVVRISKNRPLAQYIGDKRNPKKNYLYVKLCKDGVRRKCSVHRLVAEAFIPNPHNKPTVNHKNGKKDDNRVDNLEWATWQENELHSWNVLGKKPYPRNFNM